MMRIAAAVLAMAVAGCSSAPRAPSAAIKDLAPTGKLRAAIDYGNPILATKNASGGPAGVSPDLARELAKRLGVPLAFITFTSAPQLVQAVKKGTWDVAFVAIDPQRANEISQTGPYVRIEGTYLGRFMVINQAMGTPRGREAGAKYLTAFVEEMKASGFVAEALQRHKVEGASVAPAGPAQ